MQDKTTTAQCTANDTIVSNQPPQDSLYRRDGCRAWLVCLASVLSSSLLFGSTQTFGVIFPVLLDEFSEGKAKTALIGSIAMALPMTFSPIAAKIIKRFGPRAVTIVGGIVSALGLFTSSFASSVSVMYFTYSFTLGVGISLAYTSNYEIIPRYFKKRIGLATGAMHAGSGVSFFVSFLLENLIVRMGWRQTFKILSGIILIVCLCGLTFSLNVESDSRPQAHRQTMVVHERVAAVKPRRCLIICVFALVFQFGNTIPLVHLGRHAQDSGLNLGQIVYLYVGFGVATVVGRLVSGRIGDIKYIDPCYVLSFIAFIAGVSTILCPFAKDLTSLLVYFCCNGICDGCVIALTTVLILRNTSANEKTKWLSLFLFISSFGFAFGSPFGGLIADQVGSYTPVFYMSGSIVVLSSVIILTFNCTRPRTAKTIELVERRLDMLCEDLIIAEKVTVL